ncbi:MAG: triose-phosphate isomerase, partial [Moraxellaceae bacterium]|nr:triose-phosphate isomerase [Moraxellaceae bacterium]
MRRPWVAGNWKMNGSHGANAELLSSLGDVSIFSDIDVAVVPPTVYLQTVIATVAQSSLSVLAQTVSEFESGAYTGEVSVAMLQDLGANGALV